MESSATPRGPRHQVLASVAAEAPRNTRDPRMRIRVERVERLEAKIEPPFRTRSFKIRMTSDLLVWKRDYHTEHTDSMYTSVQTQFLSIVKSGLYSGSREGGRS